MKRVCWRTLAGVLLLAGAAMAEPVGVLVRVGLRDEAPTVWAGRVDVSPGRVIGLEGWMEGNGDDQVQPDGTWQLVTDALPPRRGQARTMLNGLLVALDARADSRVTLTAGERKWTFALADLAWGRRLTGLDGDADATLAPVYHTLQTVEGREDDYPAGCALPNGDTLAIWQSWSEAEGRDQVYAARRTGGAWQPAAPLPGAAGDLFGAQVTADGAGGAWAVWSAMTDGGADGAGDFELFAARLANGAWSAPQRLTTAPGHDTFVQLATAPEGTVYAVWRAYRGPSADILMATCVDGRWSAPVAVDASPANEWAPAIAAGPGGVWAAWDSYRFGSYDVFAARLSPDGPGEIMPVAATPKFEAKASVACGPNGEVWFAWQEAGEAWGKNTGRTVPRELLGEGIYRQRNVAVAQLREGRLFDLPDVAASVPEGERRYLENPRIAADGQGRLWLTHRRPVSIPRLRGQKLYTERAWETFASHLTPEGWAAERYLPSRLSRMDTVPSLAPGPDGVTVVFHTDGRELPTPRVPTANRVFATTLAADGPAAAPPGAPRPEQTPQPLFADEAAAIARCRARTLAVGGAPWRLLRGDTHRHTEVSWDGVGDGSLLDTYRYAQDAASLDFFMVSDHNQVCGVDLPYVRWRNYKLADLLHNPGVFITLFGYERSLGYPNGHRNIVQAVRGKPSLPLKGGNDDLPLLYEYCRDTDSLVIAHTTGTNHGTNWYAYDRAVEPVVEIFQGCRMSYEYEGAPKSATPGDDQAINTGYQPQGYLWRAWQKGCDLGIISSSDHGSTHYSYAAVYAPQPTREGVLDGLRSRHTYGATDNLIAEIRSGDRVLGDEWKQADPPTLEIEVVGTAELTQIDIIRDYDFVYTVDPEGSTFRTTWQDNQFTPGRHIYYLRAQQADTSLAWTSPVWIEG